VASGTEHYYSFDYGNIHFICLDANLSLRTNGAPMLRWLEQDLIATDKDWIIAFWHQPPYTWGSHNSDFERDLIEMRENAVPLLESYGVDLVLCGHSHVYERTFLLNGHYGHSTNFNKTSMALNAGLGSDGNGGRYEKPAGGLGANRGAVYVVCGNSGDGGAGAFPLHPAMATNHGGFGSVILDIDGLRLDVRYLTEQGSTEDWFTLDKSVPSETHRPTIRLSRANATSLDLAWPTSLLPYEVEDAGGFDAHHLWGTITNQPVSVGRSNIVKVPLSATNRVYRLRAEPSTAR
jgi:acid phosphatase type 7